MARKSKPKPRRETERTQERATEKGKVHETVRRTLLISTEQKQEMEKEIPSMRVITPSIVAQKYGVRVSIAKAVLIELEAKHLIRKVISGGKFKLYTKISA
ncbi:MAG: eS25 family ribosomal protein [Promethearchaeota archaeon]